MGEVDPAFVQPHEHKPKPSTIEAEDIPLIDLYLITHQKKVALSDPAAIEGLVKEIGSACKEWGFFQVINHGVPLHRRQRIDSAAKKFFKQSLEEKRKVSRDEVKVLGFYDMEYTKNVRDWKEVYDFNVEETTFVTQIPEAQDQGVVTQFQWKNQWPEYPSDFREACQDYGQEMVKLALKLLELIALSLGLPAERFHGNFKDQTSNVRLNHYPPCPFPDLALGVSPHKDTGALTILTQDDVGGLEVKRKSDGEWIRVNPIPDAYVINIGDIVQVWSNDAYESVEHKAMVNTERERFSIPFFLKPALSAMVKPVEELTNERSPPKYKPFNWGNYRTTKLRSNFKKLDVENPQIYHFKVSN